MKKKVFSLVTLLLTALLLFSCSLPPVHPVTRVQLMQTRIFDKYIFDESPEELLYALNTRGEVIIEAKRNIPGKEYLIYVKMMAATDDIYINEYDR